MKVRSDGNVYAERLAAASKAENDEVDESKVLAGQEILARLEQVAGNLQDPLEVGRRVWNRAKQSGAQQIAASMYDHGPEASGVKQRLTKASVEELGQVVDALAMRILAEQGQERALSILLDLKVTCEAGADLIPQYNQRVKSTPRRLREAEEIDPRVAKSLEALAGALGRAVWAKRLSGVGKRVAKLTDTIAEAVEGEGFDKARSVGGKASLGAWNLGRQALEGAKYVWYGEEGATPERLERDPDPWTIVAGKFRDLVGPLLPTKGRSTVAELQKNAKALVGALEGVTERADHRDEIVARFTEALPAVSVAVDEKADAVAIGMLREVNAIATGTSGSEIVYNRGKGQLVVNELEGIGGRLGVGGTLRPFVRNAFGDPDEIAKSTRRTAVEVGALVGHVGSFVAGSAGEEPVRGYSTTVSLGFNLSLPLLSDQSTITLGEKRLSTIDLTADEIAAIEKVIADAPKSEWLDLARQAVRQ